MLSAILPQVTLSCGRQVRVSMVGLIFIARTAHQQEVRAGEV